MMYSMVAQKGDQIHEVAGVTGWDGEKTPGVLVVATEGGAILFLNTAAWDFISFEPETVEQ